MNTFRAFGVLVVLAACGGSDSPHADEPAPAPPAGETDDLSAVAVDCASATIAQTVTTPGFFFQPAQTTIKVGDVVKLAPSPDHDVVSDSSADFSLSLGEEGCFRFDVAGTYPFHCRPHGFKGTIVVE